jgi:hemerythrin-like metal-binding protein
LFSLLRNFHDERVHYAHKEDLVNLLKEIVRNAEAHFRSEETVMNALNFPLQDEIRAQHFAMSESLSEIVFAYEMGFSGPDKIEEFLASWFHDHILKEDKKIADFKFNVKLPL